MITEQVIKDCSKFESIRAELLKHLTVGKERLLQGTANLSHDKVGMLGKPSKS